MTPTTRGSFLYPMLCVLLLAASATAEPGSDAASAAGPDFKDVLSLASVGGPAISPDGSAVLFTVRKADWEANRYDTEIWLARGDEEPFPLTRTKDDSSAGARWSPDGKRVAFLADRGNDTQVWLISAQGGEASPLTAVEDGVSSFRWSPDGTQMAVAITDRQDPDRKKLEETYGGFAVEDQEFRNTHLWLLPVDAALATPEGAELPPAEGDRGRGDGGR